MAWADKTLARAIWPDATNLTDEVLDDFLEAAYEQCVDFAPAHTDPVPMRYQLANVYQAREVWAASLRDSQDVIGVGDYAIRARPLTGTVKQLLRPQKGLKVIG